MPLNRYDLTGEYDNEINFVANFFEDNAPLKVHCDKFEPGLLGGAINLCPH